jgi:hypothetical protein
MERVVSPAARRLARPVWKRPYNVEKTTTTTGTAAFHHLQGASSSGASSLDS